MLGLNAVDCRTGESLARDQVEADGKEKVLAALGRSATEMRRKLGESLASIAKTNTPIQQATTASLDALKAFAMGEERGRDFDAIPFYKRAIELDPDFALAHARVGVIYSNSLQRDLGAPFTRKAFALKDRVTERERLYVAAQFYMVELDFARARETYELWKQTYPRDTTPLNNEGVLFDWTGQPAEALGAYLEAARLEPTDPMFPINAAETYMLLGRIPEAQAMIDRAEALAPSNQGLHLTAWEVAYVQGDHTGMERHAKALASTPSAPRLLLLEAAAAASQGRVQLARDINRKAIDLCEASGFKELAAVVLAREAGWNADFGRLDAAREEARRALAKSQGPVVQNVSGRALARAGELREAEALVAALDKRYPNRNHVFGVGIAALRAEIELGRGHPEAAVEILKVILPYENNGGPGIVAVFVRGRAYLKLEDGAHAAAEFQKIIDRPGANTTSQLHGLAWLGLGRARVLTRDVAGAREAYAKFLELWKDADVDVPILQQAKTEYARLSPRP